MATTYIKPARGVRKVSNIIPVAAAATPETLYQRTTGGQNPRTVILRKVMIYNNTGANAVVEIGTGLGVAFADIIPPLYSINLFDNEWTEDDLPVDEVGVSADLTVQSSVLGVQVQVEVEELGS
jgi:hypothetical protein